MGRLLLPLLAAFLSFGLLLTEAQAQETPTYLALGDSLAFGVGASDPPTRGYVALAFDALRNSDRYRDSGLELVNLGVPGATSADLLAPGGQLEAALRRINEGQVEIISIDIGGNDLLVLGLSASPCLSDPLGTACRQRFDQALNDLKTNLTQVTRSLRQAAPEAQIVIVGLYNPYSGKGGSLEVAADLGLQQINGALRSVAVNPDLGAKWADVYDLFAGRGHQWIAADGFHPNDKGHAVLAEALLAAIQDREPAIPQALLAEPPASPAQSRLPDDPGVAAAQTNDSSDTLILLAIAVPAALLGGAVISGAYFLARGRR